MRSIAAKLTRIWIYLIVALSLLFCAAALSQVFQAFDQSDRAPLPAAPAFSLDRLNQDPLLILAAFAASGVLSLAVAYALFRHLRQAVALPIKDLAALLGQVEREQDFSRRAKIVSDDEIGQLAQGINALLATLEMHSMRLAVERQEREATKQDRRIAATIFDVPEGMFITDAANVIVRVNRAFSEITGYTAEEAVGHTPRLLNAGRHDAAFFAAMKDSLKHQGTWQGEIWNRRKNGEIFPDWLTITVMKNRHGELTHYVATLTDISSRKTAEDEIRYLAYYDALTRLPNRQLFLDRLRHSLESLPRRERYGALLFIDIDNFKTVNDSHGYDGGDLLLQQVAQRLISCLREGDTVSHLRGDEFVVMLENLSDRQDESAAQARLVGEKILAALRQPYQLYGATQRSTASIGIALFANHDETVDDLLKRADLSMYHAKVSGRNTLCLFEQGMLAAIAPQHGITRRIQPAA